jgi:hypothetical protein
MANPAIAGFAAVTTNCNQALMAGVFQRYSKEWIYYKKYGSFGWKFSKGEIRVDLGLKTEPVHAVLNGQPSRESVRIRTGRCKVPDLF